MSTPEVPAALVGLASLFGSCVDAFGGFGLAQGADRETEVALLKLDIEKTRLLIWGENVGILLESRDPRLLDERVVAHIWPTLRQIKILLTDSVKLRTSYGMQALDTTPRKTIDYISSHSLAVFREDASRFWSGNASELAAVAEGAGIGRVSWTVYEKGKFQGLVYDVGRAVDDLFGLVEVAREAQDRAIIEDIESILNVSHLFIIEEAAASSYEVYSQAAASARTSIAAGTVDCRTAEEHSGDGLAAERLNALLCDTCDGLFRWHCFNFNPDHSDRQKSAYYLSCHHETLLAFMEAVDAGCWICWRVFEWLSAEFQQNLRDAALGQIVAPASVASTESSGHSYNPDHSCGSEHSYGSGHSDRSEQSYRSELSEPGDFTVYEARYVNGTDETKFRIEVSIYLHDREHAPLAGDYVSFCFFPANQKDPFVTQTTGAFANLRLTNALETWRTIRTWISDCDSNHPKCTARRSNQAWRPSRLLEISVPGGGGGGGDLERLHVRLVERAQVVDGDSYATLSHRWGGTNPIVLTTGNLDSFGREIPMSSLSRAFRDCFRAALEIGIRYVWIDSLCIIQHGDEGADWLRESVTMDQVYSNAFCNISADWATEDHGLFFPQDPRWRQGLQVNMKFSHPKLGTAADSRDGRLFDVIYPNGWHDQVGRSPLNNRGWVFQERLLAPRVLHFCPREILWECCETTLSESFPRVPIEDDVDPDTENRTLKQFRFRNSRNHAEVMASWVSESESSPVRPESVVWHDIVATYSSCLLTRGSDKLIAIAGIAKYMQRLLHDRYILGLWAKSLAGELMWSLVSDHGVSNPLTKTYHAWVRDQEANYRAPSFTWASADAPVRPGPPLLRGLAVELAVFQYRSQPTPHAALIPFAGDAFGPISSPVVEIRVTGVLKRMRFVKDKKRRYLIRPDLGDAVEPDSGSEENDSERSGTSAVLGTTPDLDFVITKSAEPIVDSSTFYYMRWNQDDKEVSLLLLQLVEITMGRFRRIGTKTLFERIGTVGEMKAKEFLKRQDGEDANPCWSYHKDTGKHTIFLV